MREDKGQGGGLGCHVGTFAFFDLEATGLPGASTRITELSVVAVTRDDLEQLHRDVVRFNANRMGDLESMLLPRVVNKLTFCVYPWTTIPLHVEHITGLSNDKLEKQGRFDANLVTSLSSFLSRLHPPVCLVAHNGVKFDFPLLQAELFKSNGSLIDGLLCCDSWLGANHIYNNQRLNETQTEHLNEPLEKEKPTERFETLEEVAAAERLVEAGAFQDTLEEPILELVDSQEEVNCRTPTRSSSLSLTPPPSGGTSGRKRGGGGVFDSEPAEGSSLSPSKLRRPEGMLTPEARATPQAAASTGCLSEVKSILKAKKKLDFTNRPASFSLVNLHHHLLGAKPKSSHGAEADCLALLRVTAALGQDWLHYADQAAQPFHESQRMW